MRLVKPGWLGHKHENRPMELYSVSVSPDGQRVVTGGFDGKVRVWSAAAIADPESESRRQLAAMSAHTGSVVCVRFSPDGRYIASGSDDRIALIWELDASRQPHKEFGSKEDVFEVWTARKKLIGHESDVQDLAWSADGHLLVTVGLDSAILVWSGSTFEKLAEIDSHTSSIKGITFDPANKYFVTCSDDRSVRIFRYNRGTEFTYSVEAVITEPFVNSPLSTYFCRPSWSPNGENIACPNATNGWVPTVCIINRGSWEADISFVGHQGPVEVCAFSPRVYSVEGANELVTVVATAGNDNCIAIWNTTSPRPLLVARNVSVKAVCDLAWGPDGLKLYAASLDGTVLLVEFSKGDLGEVMDKDEVTQSLLRYGSSTNDMNIPESAEQLRVAESVTNDDDKMDTTEDPEKKEPAPPTIPNPVTLSTPVPTASSTTTPLPATEPAPAPQVNVLPVKQKTSVTKDGRKRITPVLVSNSTSSGVNTNLAPQLSAAQPLARATAAPAPEYSKPTNGLPRGGVSALVVGTRRKPEDAQERPQKRREIPEFIRPAVINPASVVSSARLATPKVFTHLSTDSDQNSVLEARNGTNLGDPARISVSHDGLPVFVDFVPNFAHLLAGSADYFWAVSTEDGSIYTYSPQGVRLLPPMAMGSALVLMTAREFYLTVVTCTGLVQAWNLKSKKSLFPAVSLAPILDSASRYTESGALKAPAVTQVWCADNGSVMVTLNNGSAYTYNPDMMVWSRISEPFWAYGSQFWDSTGFASLFENTTGGPVAAAERRTNEEVLLKNAARGKQLQRIARNRMLQDGYNGFEDSVSLSHLETRIAAAQQLNSPELTKYLDLYVNRLSRDGAKERLVELFNSVLAGRFDPLDKKDLLRQLLAVAAKHAGAQSLVVEYNAVIDH